MSEDAPNVTIVTLTPIDVPFYLQPGSYEQGSDYLQLQREIAALPSSSCAVLQQAQTQQYEDLSKDVYYGYLLKWSTQVEGIPVHVYLFKHGLGIVEITFNEPLKQTPLECSQNNSLQLKTKAYIDEIYPRLENYLADIYQQINNEILLPIEDEGYQRNIYWVTRMLCVERPSLNECVWQDLVTCWLASTSRPEDANDILTGKLDHSMTWLNYVVVDKKRIDSRVDAMILAQYFYTAQDNCNNELKNSIAMACAKKSLDQVQNTLTKSRLQARLLDIEHNEHCKYLTREKRRLLKKILAVWDFESLLINSQKMVDVCSERIDEAHAKKRERSSVMTDLLLVGLSFFAIFELSLSLTELSREMVSRPALYYNDEQGSVLLGIIANVEADVMVGSGFALTILFVVIYKFLKFR